MHHGDFVHLHLHTQYSLLDGAIRIPDLIARAKEYKMSALTITDHGSLFGALEFYSQVQAQGIKPIVGCEVYVAPGSRKTRRGPGSSRRRGFSGPSNTPASSVSSARASRKAAPIS